jgi:biotin carboxyl carrier protein
METSELRQIAGWLQAADIDCIEIGKPGRTIRMLRGPNGYAIEDRAAALAPAAPAPDQDNTGRPPVVAIATGVGIFLTGHPMRPSPMVGIGDRVEQGDAIALLQVGHLLAPVLAPASGTVGRVLVVSASRVDYGTALVEIQAGGT